MTTLRVAYNRLPVAEGHVDLAVTPRALVHLDREKSKKYFKPIDFLSQEDIKSVKHWSAETVMAMACEWREKGGILPLLIEAVGVDLCILLEYIKIADLVLTRAWDRGDFTSISADAFEMFDNLIQYGWANYGYVDLLFNEKWCKQRSIEVESTQYKTAIESVHHKDPFTIPFWKRCAYMILGLYRCSQRIKVLSMIGMKMGFADPVIPRIIVVPTRNVEIMMKCEGSVCLKDYLLILPKNRKKAQVLQSEVVSLLEQWFSQDSPAMKRIDLYKEIIENRLVGFIKKRLDLVTAYVQMKELKNSKPLKMLLGSTIGCGIDAWCSMSIQENGGVVASGQHGGGYGNAYTPYVRFSDLRYKYFFSYGQPEITPLCKYHGKFANAELVKAGSPVLYDVQQSCGSPPPTEVVKILYVMNLCVPFYSANFPWENILEQLKVLELLNTFSNKYTIDVKEEQTNTIQHSIYPGLKFIKESPVKVLHDYDLLIVESCISTAVLEVAATNKFLVVFTGAKWEDASRESLDMLCKRAECFHNWNSFLSGLKEILENPESKLDIEKLNSSEFMDTFCNPVPAEKYINTVKETLELR